MSRLSFIVPALAAAFIVAGSLDAFAAKPVTSGKQPTTDIRNDSMTDHNSRPGMNDRVNDRETSGVRNTGDTRMDEQPMRNVRNTNDMRMDEQRKRDMRNNETRTDEQRRRDGVMYRNTDTTVRGTN